MNRARGRRLSAAAVLLAVAAGGTCWWVLRSSGAPASVAATSSATATATPTPTTSSPVTQAAATTSGVYGVPTTGPVPTSAATDVATDAPAPADLQTRVVLTYSSWSSSTAAIGISAYVAGVVEDGGTCTATATAPGVTRSASSAAGADATTSVCSDLVVPWTSTDGPASVVVRYTSATVDATSSAVAVQVGQ